MRLILILCSLAFLLLNSSANAQASAVQLPQSNVTQCYDYFNYVISCGADGAGGATPPGIGQDGAVQAGMPLPNPRFLFDRGTYIDTFTGLVWLANPVCSDSISGISPDKNGGTGLNWGDALSWSHGLAAGFCALADGSKAGDWRLPNVNELKSLLTSDSHNFLDGDSWSSTTLLGSTYFLSRTAGISTEADAVSTLHHVWGVRDEASGVVPVGAIPKSGQSVAIAPYDDGSLQKGTAWPIPRFRNNGNGVITDGLTGLLWLQNATCGTAVGGITPDPTAVPVGALNWGDALVWSNNLASGACGLSDGSQAGDWRLPNQIELSSLGNFGAVAGGPAWLVSQGFNLANRYDAATDTTSWLEYWSSDSGWFAYSVVGNAYTGIPGAGTLPYPDGRAAQKDAVNFVLPVRGGLIGYGVTLRGATSELSLVQGGTAGATFTTSVGGGFSSDVTLGITSLPVGVTAVFSLATVAAPGSGGSALTLTAGADAPLGSYPVTISATGGGVTVTTGLIVTILTPSTSLAGALDSSLQWFTGGDLPWFSQSVTTHDGMNAAQAGRITDAQNSIMESRVMGPDTLSFWWKVSSENGFDYLRFYIDGVEQKGISGEVDWTNERYELTTGAHILRWAYTKDGAGSGGADTGWVDSLALASQGTFTLAASSPATVTIAPGGSGRMTFVTSPWGAFNSVVNLIVSGLPSGVTASFVPTAIAPPGSGSSIITLTAATDVILGSYPVKITAMGGGVTQSFTTPVVVGVSLAQALDTTRDVTSGGDLPWFAQTAITHDGIDAAQAGKISDGQSSFMESVVTGPTTISFWWKVSSEPEWDFLRFEIDGVEQKRISGEVDWTNVIVTIPSGVHTLRWAYTKDSADSNGEDTGWVDALELTETFTLASYPAALLVVPGGTGSTTIATTVSQGFGNDITLGVTGLPTGVTASFSPAFIPAPGSGGSVMTLTATGDVALGSYPVTITAVGGGMTRMVTLMLTISTPLADALDTPLAVITGGAATWFSQKATTHDGIDAVQAGAIGDGQSSFFESRVNGPDMLSFWWKVSSESGYDFLSFSIDGVQQSAITGEVDWTNEIHPLTSGEHTLRWEYKKDATGSGGLDTGWVDELLPASQGTFALAASPSALLLAQGGAVSTTVIGSVWGAFAHDVTLTVTGLPTGVTLLFTPATIPGGSGAATLTLTAATDVPLGSYPVTVSATGGGVTRNVTLTLITGVSLAQALDTTFDVTTGGESNWFAQSVTTHDGINAAQAGAVGNSQSSHMESSVNGPTTLSFWWKVSSEAGYDFLWYALDGVEQKRISGDHDWSNESITLSSGAHTLRWGYTKDGTGSGGSDTGWVDTLVVANTFTLATYPTALLVTPGGTGSATATTTVGGGFSSAVTLSVAGLPSGVTLLLTPESIAAPGGGSATMTLTAAANASSGTYPVTVIATGGGVSRTVMVSLTVSLPLSQALNSTLELTTGGAATWFSQSVITHDGSDAAQAGGIGDGESSYMERAVAGPDTLSFWWKVSSEGTDYLRYYLDGVEQKKISGEKDWSLETLAIPAGVHTLRWEYAKDATGKSGWDTGWVDELVLASQGSFTLSVSPAAVSLSPGGMGSATIATLTQGFSSAVTFIAAGLPAGVTANLTSTIIPAPGSGATTVTLTAAADAPLGSYPVRITATGGGVTRTITLTVAIAISLAEALDTTRDISTGGNLPWSGQRVITHDGIDAAQAGAIGDGQSSFMESVVSGPSTVSFWWKVSSESGYDYLRFYLDGVEQKALSGEVDWTNEILTLTQGVHTIRWEYTKDRSGMSGSDAGWVDELVVADTFTLAASLPAVTVAPGGGGAPTSLSLRGAGSTMT